MPTRNAKPGTRNVLRLALVQHACGPDPRKNQQTAEGLIRQAARRGADLVVTQELFLSRYFPQVTDERHFALAQPIPGPASRRLCALAAKLRISLIASLFEQRAPGLYHNTAIVIGPTGGIVGKYRKMHIPDDPRFYEKYYFAPGDLGWQTHAIPYAGCLGLSPRSPGDSPAAEPGHRRLCPSHPVAHTGVLICWDQWYPEAARLTALRGAQLLVYPTAIGWWRGEPAEVRRQQLDAWITIQRSHAIANGVFVAAVNRVGVEDDLEFWGRSFVCDPAGVMLDQAAPDHEQVLLAECDLSRIEQQRHGWPFLRDRRIDAYEGLTRTFEDSGPA